MKILSKEQIREADQFTINHEPISSIDLMERAANKFTELFMARFPVPGKVFIFCGKGNNGGDGLVISRLLLQKGWDVDTLIVHYTKGASDDFKFNYERLLLTEGRNILHINRSQQFPEIDTNAIIIDALWGTGLSRPIEGFSREIIHKINSSNSKKVAVDIPSGLYCDKFNEDNTIVNADLVISFQCPKFSFFMAENGDYVKEFVIADIGLSREFLSKTDTPFHYVENNDLPKLKARGKFSHKGTFGHTLTVGGSYGKMGSIIMTSKACLVSGAGLVTSYIPKCGYEIFQTSMFELMVLTDKEENFISQFPDSSSFDCIAVGPGMGQDKITIEAFEKFLKNLTMPLVIDADGLNILSQRKEYLAMLPKNSILTPHPGEFARLTEESKNSYERIDHLKAFSKKYKCITVLKGAYTAIALPGGNIYFNATGNPGMATAGSGDVLTGVIASLLSQKYEPWEAAILGVFMHGLAGDLASDEKGQEGMIAGDIINHIPNAIKHLKGVI